MTKQSNSLAPSFFCTLNLIAKYPQINSKGGLKAIVISHPHYYTTYAEWAQAFKCPIYIASDDQNWLCQKPPTPQTLSLVDGAAGAAAKVLPGVSAIKTGGHFPGSLVLHWEKKLFIADSIVTVPVSTKHLPVPRIARDPLTHQTSLPTHHIRAHQVRRATASNGPFPT